ncbi:MAG: hypothetical protein M1420_06055 [Actinobacteria bacterium]|nr:hypothetical protein [Actinomycetota bacterium]
MSSTVSTVFSSGNHVYWCRGHDALRSWNGAVTGAQAAPWMTGEIGVRGVVA